jgi:hypothetical protein
LKSLLEHGIVRLLAHAGEEQDATGERGVVTVGRLHVMKQASDCLRDLGA